MKNRRKWIGVGGLVLVLMMMVWGRTIASAIFDGDTDATHINPAEIENSTLIIGTHLIHISALTDEIYDMAVETAEASNQMDMYYKSELGNGAWYRISEASGLSDITLPDKKTEDAVIRELYIRYHTKSDGITYDLLNGEAICVFDTVNPYDVGSLKEFDSVNIQLEQLESKENKSDADKENIENIEEVLAKGQSWQDTNAENDKALARLNQMYIERADNEESRAVLMSVMQQIDNNRRQNVYSELGTALEELIDKVQEADDGENVNYDLIDAIGTSLEEVMNKETACEADALQQGNTALSNVKFNVVQQLIDTDDSETAETLCENLTDLAHITEGFTVYPDREAALIVDTLLPASDEMILHSSDEAAMSSAFAEGEFLTETAVAKMSQANAEELIRSRTETLNNLVNQIQDTQLRAIAEKLKQDSIRNLEELEQSLKGQSGTEMDKLLAEKDSLQLEMKKALDKNDLQTAAEYEAAISEIDVQIEELNNRLIEILASDTASDSEKAKAESELGAGLMSTLIADTKDSVLNEIAEGRYDEISMGLETIQSGADSCPQLAVSALKEIYEELSTELYLREDNSGDAATLEGLLTAIEDMVADMAVYLREQPATEQLMNIIEEQAGNDFDGCSEEEQAVIIAGLARYGTENGDTGALELAAELANDAYQMDNSYIYMKLQNEALEFIPLDKLAECCGYRYVYHNGNQTGIIRNGTDYYEYQAFRTLVKSQKLQTEEMDTYARYQSTIYLSKDYVQQTFGVSAEYLSGSAYGVILTEAMEDKITVYVEAFLQTASD